MANGDFVSDQDKVILSDVLFYLQNKMHTTSFDDIAKTCDMFYDDEYILNEKQRFFDAIGKKPVGRRTSDKKIKDIGDILTEMRTRDDNRDFMPVCAAKTLSNIPLLDDGTVSNSQILSSL